MTNKLLFSRDHITIECPRGDEETLELITQLYPIHANRIQTRFTVSIRDTPEVLKLFRGVTAENILSAPETIQNHFFKEMMLREETTRLLTQGPQEVPVVNHRLTLDPHQQLGRELAKYHAKYGFFYDTRTGKTPMSLAIINDSIQEDPAIKWLVICPLKLINLAWIVDIQKFFPGEMKYINCHATGQDERLRRIATPGANVYITNIESFVKYQEYFANAGLLENVIVDESSSMKSNSTKQSKTLVDVGNAAKRFYLLSGTPAPNDESEYYMQMSAIDRWSVPQSYAQYCAHYLIDHSRSHQYHKYVLNPACAAEFKKQISRHAIYVDQSVLNLPGREFHEVEIQMPKELREHYRLMKNKLYVELQSEGENIKVIAPSIAAKLNKLNQITSGFVIDTDAIKENKYFKTDKDEWHLLDTYRFDFLERFLESDKCKGEPVIIWAHYRKEFEIIKQRLGSRCALVYGGVSNAEQIQAIQDFLDSKVQYLIANPASADKGLTLTVAHKAIYFSLGYSYELFKQSAERIYGDKRSQPHFCDYYIFMTEGTIDPIIYREVLTRKATASRSVMNHLKPEVLS